ncbi:MAG: hypothetical protein M9941_12090 [Anaerolineae bacterium]|nr:hypothetical protein [Anaerolineae bacterium]MCO5198475.1 hypothetical protein [Anaerolineae bacterium]
MSSIYWFALETATYLSLSSQAHVRLNYSQPSLICEVSAENRRCQPLNHTPAR